MIVPKHYENLKVLHENTMPARAYYIPASYRMDNLVFNREESDRMTLLNDTWKFKYYKSIYDLKENFYEEGYDISKFDEMNVPGVWQMAGYDSQQYTNVKYPIPFDPPYVPLDNPCGAYVYDFDFEKSKDAPKNFLNFEAVDSCFYVWLNGQYVGYSQVTHMTSEFDVTDLLRDGKNRLAVLVLKYCDGTYLEDQDKFRMSGIIRDVYILSRPEKFVYDYFIHPELKNSDGKKASIENLADYVEDKDKSLTGNVTIDFSYFASVSAITQVSIFDKDDNELDSKEVSGNKVSFEIKNPALWSHEDPYLYTVVISTKNGDETSEVIVDRLGFRSIDIKDAVVYLNGHKLKLRGMNRHESDPDTGSYIKIDQLLYDLKLMRESNINAIRTSHYPNAPYFYQICDEYGFLICDEADLEAHGPSELYRKVDTWENHINRWNEDLVDNPEWTEAICDRVNLMLRRDKNRPCVIIWSMGNECAYGCCFEEALKMTKAFDKSRITQYESSRYRNPNKSYDFSNLDLYSRMYPSLAEMDEYFDRDGSKPFILIEYCHAMGNGPGDLEDYFQYIENNDKMMGGFIWEWCDHAIFKGRENGRDKYFYGGDHGEAVHDGNFCMDGMVYPDRTLHTGLREYENVNRPARVKKFDAKTGELVLHNYLTFTDLSDYAEIHVKLMKDGKCESVDEYIITDYSVKPLSDGKITIDMNKIGEVPERGKVTLIVSYVLKNSTELVMAKEVGFDEILIKNKDGRNSSVVDELENLKNSKDNGALTFSEDDEEVIITCSEPSEGLEYSSNATKFIYKYSKKTGLFTSIIKDDAREEILEKPMDISIWRAPTDNDINIKKEWIKACYHMAYVRAYRTELKDNANTVEITTIASMGAPTVQKIMDIEMKWVIYPSGLINCKMDVKKNDEFPELPRFGVRFYLKDLYTNLSYEGYGPYESYVDKRRASYYGKHSVEDISEMLEDYIKPQENGSHIGTNRVHIEGKNNTFTVLADCEDGISFSALKYTAEEMTDKKHNFELEEGPTVLAIDYKLNGIGSNSCGPELLDKYKFSENEFSFEFNFL